MAKIIINVGYLLVLIVLIYMTDIESKSVQFEDCGSTGAKVTNVGITPCNRDPCPVTPGENSTVAVSFVAKEAADNITVKAYGFIAGIKVPYPLPQPQACKDSNITCPLKPNSDYVYDLTLAVPDNLPKVNVVVELDMLVMSTKYVCINVPVVVTPHAKFINLP